MRIYSLYFLSVVLALSACDNDFGTDAQVITHKRIFVLYDTLDAPDRGPEKTPDPDTSYLEYVFRGYELENLQSLDSTILVDLKYADTSNFMKINFYDGLRHAYFPCEVAWSLCKAQFYLKQINPSFSIVVLDASRPLHIQQLMWDSLKMPNDRKFNYLSPPYETSLHNYGCAADVTIMDLSKNQLMDMGSDFDTFEKISQPVYEQKFLKSGALTEQAIQNRRLLRWVMKSAGFSPIPSEWWHFGYGNKTQAAAKFKLIK